MKLTDWFPADVKPTHIGEYDFKYESGYQFRAFLTGLNFLSAICVTSTGGIGPFKRKAFGAAWQSHQRKQRPSDGAGY